MSGPVNVVVALGITDSTALPFVTNWIANCAMMLLPDATSVARSVANCVGTFGGTRMVTAAMPF